MELVTEEQVAAARRAAEDAALVLTGDREGWSPALEEMQWRAIAAAAQARVLAERLAEQNAVAELRKAAEARKTAEEAAEPVLDEMAAKLAASRDRAVQAITDAETALSAMVDAVTDHKATVLTTATELTKRGLQARDAVGDHETGAAKTGLVLRAEWWLPSDPGGALAAAVYVVAVEKLGYSHPISARLRYGLGREAMVERGGLAAS